MECKQNDTNAFIYKTETDLENELTAARGKDREEQAALLRIRTWPECPEGNLRELA